MIQINLINSNNNTSANLTPLRYCLNQSGKSHRPTNFLVLYLYTRYPIVARALGLAAAFRPSASCEQRYLAYKSFTTYKTFLNLVGQMLTLFNLGLSLRERSHMIMTSARFWQILPSPCPQLSALIDPPLMTSAFARPPPPI